MQRLIVIDRVVEELRVRLEGDEGAVQLGVADDLHLLGDRAAGELHLVDLAVAVDLDDQPLAQRVDDRSADAVQAAGYLVASAAEFAAGVQHRIDDLESGSARLGLDVHRDAAAVVGDGDRVAGIDCDRDVRAEAGQRLVDGVVHDLIDKVVETRGRGRADVHAGALAHGLETLEHLDLRGVVALFEFFRFFRIVCHIFLHRSI